MVRTKAKSIVTALATTLALGLALALSLPPTAAYAISTIEFLSSLSDTEVENFQAWRAARNAYEQQLDRYWDEVDARRNERKKKRSAKIPFDASDYVMSFPPSYAGPKLSPELAKKYAKFTDDQEKAQPTPPKDMATVADYLDAAKRVYNFTPERLTEKEFKRRYAEEAVALGLAKDQVVRVYALETGGIGTYDMQAGIHPIKKTGRAISSALGYAQLLDANSVNELSQHGQLFLDRLASKAKNPNLSAERRAALKTKIAGLRKMYINAKRQPFEWEHHQAYAKTPEGMGMHALNIDGDVGPMMQAMKLKGLKDTALKFDRPDLSGAEMELMNLSGPVTGLEMMMPYGRKAPVTNSFTRRAYYVNKMVVGLTGEQLLAELDRRMDDSMKTPGSQEFASAFDSVVKGRTAGR
ncbi:MAG: hypothetical protein HOP09_15470 [Hyphomicrobium sp.]|nr:hypothetical protein [Hyphomicrobium sp.]